MFTHARAHANTQHIYTDTHTHTESDLRSAFNKYSDFFVQAFKIVVIAIHLMR